MYLRAIIILVFFLKLLFHFLTVDKHDLIHGTKHPQHNLWYFKNNNVTIGYAIEIWQARGIELRAIFYKHPA